MGNEGFDPSYAAGPEIGLVVWLLFAAIYFYSAFTQYKMAQKCGHSENAWWSYIPIMNVFLLCQMAQKEMWWVVLFLVPLVNIYAFGAVWVAISKRLGHSGFWGIMAILPFLNFVAYFVLSFTGSTPTYQRPTPPPQPQQRREPTQVG